MAFQLSKFVLNDSRFLSYRPSQLAACSVLIAINIFKRDEEEYQKTGVFSGYQGSLEEFGFEPQHND